MEKITWAQAKAEIEAQGVKDDDEIVYIDWHATDLRFPRANKWQSGCFAIVDGVLRDPDGREEPEEEE